MDLFNKNQINQIFFKKKIQFKQLMLNQLIKIKNKPIYLNMVNPFNKKKKFIIMKN